MIKEVLTTGNELLGQVSKEVALDEFGTPQLDAVVKDMIDTKNSITGAVGIAAIQIGVLKRITVIGYGDGNLRYKDTGNFPTTVIINPSFEAVGDEVFELNEGCLSVPGTRGDVIRPRKLRYKYQDITGAIITGESDDFFARVLQHEVDHMNGILFPMRIEGVDK